MTTSKGQSASLALLWERHSFSKDAGEQFSDVSGIGRFSIRRTHSAQYMLSLNGKPFSIRGAPAVLKSFAQEIIHQRMLSHE